MLRTSKSNKFCIVVFTVRFQINALALPAGAARLNGVWLNDVLSLFVKSLAIFLPAGSQTGMEGYSRWGYEGASVRDLYVLCKKHTTLSVRRQVMQNHFSSASHSLGSICCFALFFWAFSGAFSHSRPPSPSHLGHTDLARVWGGGGDTEQEGGRKANGGIVERTRLRKKCESDSSCVVNSTSFLSPIQSHSLCYL